VTEWSCGNEVEAITQWLVAPSPTIAFLRWSWMAMKRRG